LQELHYHGWKTSVQLTKGLIWQSFVEPHFTKPLFAIAFFASFVEYQFHDYVRLFGIPKFKDMFIKFCKAILLVKIYCFWVLFPNA
jgi:hypothetical protein